MPRVKLTKSAIDAFPRPAKDTVYWDSACPGFGVKVTPKGRKVFIVLYRTGGAGSWLRKYTIGPYGRVTLHQARAAALKIFAARTEGRDPAAEKQHARRRLVTDRIEDLVELFISEHVSKNRSVREISRLLRREVIPQWGGRSIHEISKRHVIEKISKRHVIELVMEVAARGTPSAANKLHKVVKTFFTWCIGRAILDLSPAKGVAAPARERARERVLHDEELVRVIRAARQINGPYGGIVELLALTGQRREEVAQLTWDELDLTSRAWTIPASRTKNGKSHIVHLSKEAIAGGIDERMGGGPRWRMTNANPSERSSVMKLPSQLVERTLSQFEAEALPDNHPAVEQLNQLFGDHTFFLDGNGLHIIEPAEPTETGAQAGVIVKLASWNDSSRTSLAPHSPEPTDLIIVLEAA